MINVVELNFHHRIRSGFAVQNHLTAEYIADVVSERTSERKNFGFCPGRSIPVIVHTEDRNHDFGVMNNELIFSRFPIRLRLEYEFIAAGTCNFVLRHPSVFVQDLSLLQSIR